MKMKSGFFGRAGYTPALNKKQILVLFDGEVITPLS